MNFTSHELSFFVLNFNDMTQQFLLGCQLIHRLLPIGDVGGDPANGRRRPASS